MEEKIAKWASTIIGGSYIVFGLLVLSIMAITKMVSGELFDDPFLIKALVIAVLYAASVLLVATLPGKPLKRRAVSWVVSIIFHAGLLFYLGVLNKFGSVILIIGIVETLIIMLSATGLGLLIYGHYCNQSA